MSTVFIRVTGSTSLNFNLDTFIVNELDLEFKMNESILFDTKTAFFKDLYVLLVRYAFFQKYVIKISAFTYTYF